MTNPIDTQILIWAIVDPGNLSPNTISILGANRILVSQISLFEIAIKQKINKLPEFSISIVYLIKRLKEDNFEILNLATAHLATYNEIPLISSHKDPFDRLLLATCLSEDISFISADEKFKSYGSIISLVENK